MRDDKQSTATVRMAVTSHFRIKSFVRECIAWFFKLYIRFGYPRLRFQQVIDNRTGSLPFPNAQIDRTYEKTKHIIQETLKISLKEK
jgi:hypothetical protein